MHTISIIILITLLNIYTLNTSVFGKLPTGERLNKIRSLANYRDGEFKNLSDTPLKPDDVSYFDLIYGLIKGNKNGSPKHIIPHKTPDFSNSDEFKMTWFGHSSYLIQVGHRNILVDPIFSERVSPFQFIGAKNFKGTEFIKPEQLPPLDIILITHDHYDHLDYQSILQLKNKTSQFITSSGVGAHLERWGIDSCKIAELAWNETFSPFADCSFTATSARHFSGRKFKRNQTLWSSFVLQTKNNKIYLGGDSGYDLHFKEIGKTYGPFDLAILECGQYDNMWPLIHMMPEQVIQAAIDLNAKLLLPVHWGKFSLALHDWDDPIIRITKKAHELNFPILTPYLGQTFNLKDSSKFSEWWSNI